jgi:parallel beta-helix repeat protein
MRSAALLLLPLVTGCAGLPSREIELSDRLVITESVRIRPGRRLMRFPGDGAIRIRGSNLVVDFQGAIIAGSVHGADPDGNAGIGIFVEGGRNVTLRNANVHGFKVGILARGVEGLTVTGCDLSLNWRQRLHSTPEAEAAEDWLYGHQNDDNEWLRYGAALYLDRCPGAVISGNKGQNGQNGICMTRSDGCRIFDNDFSFNSGWGLAMYRSSRNVVSRNRFNWCIRGYSHGVYSRGQDSAGILVYEQSSDNVFAYNSATHGGDGFFLWAGHETLDRTGEGGCNRNLLYRNDFSHAAANGIEATFSVGNRFVENRIEECDHGVWAGYSTETLVRDNYIARCANGISIEHGNGNAIEGNAFEENGVAINLWWDADEDLFKTAYGAKRNVKSERYAVSANSFRADKTAIRLRQTTKVRIEGNNVVSAGRLIDADASCAGVVFEGNNLGEFANVDAPVGANWWLKPPKGIVSLDRPVEIPRRTPMTPPAVDGERDVFLAPAGFRGRKHILVDQWGPYDFSHPRLSTSFLTAEPEATLRALGLESRFEVVNISEGIEVTPREGILPATLKVRASRSGPFHFQVAFEARPTKETVQGFALVTEWNVRWHRWESAGAGKPPADWEAVKASEPIETAKVLRLDFRWPGKPSEKVPADHFATIATTDVELEAGEYEIRTVSDDGIRVRVDGKVVIEDWTWHPPKFHAAQITLAKGKHAIVVEHFEIDGYAQLKVTLRPAKP